MARSWALLILLVTGSVVVPTAHALEICETDGLRYDCITETVQTRSVPLYYGVDDVGVRGTQNTSTIRTVFATWPPAVGHIPVPQDRGMRVGASAEMPVTMYHLNATGGHFPYTPGVSLTYAPFSNLTDLTPVARYTLRASSQVLVTGASDVFYRGVVNMTSAMELHVLEIKNATGDVVLRTSTSSNDEAEVVGGRAYYHLNFPFYADQNYTFTEYVRFNDATAPVDSVELWVSPADVPAFGASSFIGWPGDAVQSTIAFPPAYSFVVAEGLAPAGQEYVLEGDANYSYHDVQMFAIGRAGADPSRATLLIPLRHPTPLDIGISHSVLRSSTGETVDLNSPAVFTWYHNVTGSLLFNVTLDQSASEGYNQYAVTLRVNLSPGEALTYNRFPPGQDWGANRAGAPHDLFTHAHLVSSCTPSVTCTDRIVAWIPHMEVMFEDNATTPLDITLQVHSAAVNTLTRVLYALSWVPGADVVLRTAGWLTDGSFTVDGLCRGINRAAVSAFVADGGDPTALPVSEHRLFCNEQLMEEMQDAGNAVFTGLACTLAAGATTAAFLARNLPAAIVAATSGVACGTNVHHYLPDWLLDIVEVIRAAVEKIGQFLSEYGGMILVVIGIFLAPYLFFIMIKYPLLMVLGPIAGLMGYQRASQWPVFDRVYHYYMFGWTELVENRLLKMGVKR